MLFFSERRKAAAIGVLLFGVVSLTFLPSIHNGFVSYDDPRYITSNRHVTSGLSWANIRWAFGTTAATNWHPLTWLSHMLDVSLFGVKASGHHLTSLLLHAANAVLLFLFLWRATGTMRRSLFVAAVFGLHPLRVESVAWAAERKDVLSLLFALLALHAYVSYARRRKAALTPALSRPTGEGDQSTPQPSGFNLQPADAGPSAFFYVLSLVFFTLGLLSKPMLVTLPFVLLLLDYWPLGRFGKPALTPALSRRTGEGDRSSLQPLTFNFQPSDALTPALSRPTGEGDRSSTQHSAFSLQPLYLWLEKVPFLLLAAASCVVTYVAQRPAMVWMARVPFLDRLANAAVSYWRYLGKLFWPSKLAVLYPLVDWPGWTVALSFGALLAVSVLAVVWRRRVPYFFVGWFWFIGTLIPVIGLVAVGEQSMADRYTYLPSIGVLILLAWGMHDLVRGWRRHAAILAAASTGAVLACIAITRQNLDYWADTEHLFRHALDVTDKNYRACVNLGAALFYQGRIDEAQDLFGRAVVYKPDSPEAHSDLGVAFWAKKRFAEGIAEYEEAIRLKPTYAAAHLNLADALEKSGRLDMAIQEYRRAAELEQRSACYRELGLALVKKGELAEARIQLELAIRLDPGDGEAHRGLAEVLRRQGRVREAAGEFQEALNLNPNDESARTNLDLLLLVPTKRLPR